jgi:hypothetical protein
LFNKEIQMTAKKPASVKEVVKAKAAAAKAPAKPAAKTASKKPAAKPTKDGGKPVKGVAATPTAKPARNVLREVYKNLAAATNKALDAE